MLAFFIFFRVHLHLGYNWFDLDFGEVRMKRCSKAPPPLPRPLPSRHREGQVSMVATWCGGIVVLS